MATSKETMMCSFAGGMRTTFWQNCGNCHIRSQLDGINPHSKNSHFWKSQIHAKSQLNANVTLPGSTISYDIVKVSAGTSLLGDPDPNPRVFNFLEATGSVTFSATG